MKFLNYLKQYWPNFATNKQYTPLDSLIFIITGMLIESATYSLSLQIVYVVLALFLLVVSRTLYVELTKKD